jgi:predicted acylesterase/phospholipase RssA
VNAPRGQTPQSDLGEDLVEPPPPLTERPPNDRFCDLVLTGGVASGIVYPWAVLELARHYHFKSIGGTSVGAMAAALTAAAEYGRRTGWKDAFEVLRRAPGRLAQELPRPGSGVTQLQALFQPAPHGRRLFGLFVQALRIFNSDFPADDREAHKEVWRRRFKMGWAVVKAYWPAIRMPAAVPAALAVALWLHAGLPTGWIALPAWLLVTLALAVLGGAVGLAFAVARDIRRGIVDNDLGLCRGGHVDGNPIESKALCEWLHDGINRAAGIAPDQRALTFRDLWNAPAYPGAPGRHVAEDEPASQRAIQLEMITTNVTLGRPFSLPLRDETCRLFFRRRDFDNFFSPGVMAALMEAAKPYLPVDRRDPPRDASNADLFELPGADLPIVVAARLSLSFPVLFSALPLYAIDYEGETGRLERCWFSDGGLCSNFPVHLFDAALPNWPTFGMWIGRRSPYRPHDAVWLPNWHSSGGSDRRMRFDPEDSMAHLYRRNPLPPGQIGFLAGFLVGAVRTAKDWSDHARMRLPQVRNRVARLGLVEGEGELNITMSRATLLKMAAQYGVAAGRRFVDAYGTQPDGTPGRHWSEQRWVRLQVLLQGLRGLLGRCAVAGAQTAYTTDMRQAIDDAVDRAPLQEKPAPGGGQPPQAGIGPAAAASLHKLLDAVLELEDRFGTETTEQPYRAKPASELRLRPKL